MQRNESRTIVVSGNNTPRSVGGRCGNVYFSYNHHMVIFIYCIYSKQGISYFISQLPLILKIRVFLAIGTCHEALLIKTASLITIRKLAFVKKQQVSTFSNHNQQFCIITYLDTHIPC